MGNPPRIFRFGSIELDEAAFELRCVDTGKLQQVEPLPLRLLFYLVEHRNRVVLREELIEQVWRSSEDLPEGAFLEEVVSDDALYAAVNAVRKALRHLRRTDEAPAWIQTKPGVGYRFRSSEEVAVRVAQRTPGRGRLLYGNPRHPSAFFQGRMRELHELETLLAADDRNLSVSIEGLAGIGKTEVALQLVHQLARERRFPGGIFWLDAENLDLRPSWGTIIADQYGVPKLPLEQRCAEVLRVIEEDAQRVLLVLDNVSAWDRSTNPQPLPTGPHIRMLVTTRTRDLAGTLFRHVELPALQSPHDRQLLLDLVGRHPDPGVAELLAYIGGYALALELAGAFLKLHQSETAASYLRTLEDDPESVEHTVVDRIRYERTMAQAFRTIWNRLEPSAQKAWQIAALFEPEPATRALAAAVGLDPQGLLDLEQRHLIRPTPDGLWIMHRLTRAFGQRMCKPEERDSVRRSFVLGCLLYTRDIDADTAFELYVTDRPHLDAALAEIGRQVFADDSLELNELRDRIGTARHLIGDTAGARALLERAANVYRARLDDPTLGSTERAVLSGQLGSALGKFGEREASNHVLEEAVQAYRSGLEHCSRSDSPARWAALHHELGLVLTKLGDRKSDTHLFDQAIQSYRLALQERTRESAAPQWATTQQCLATALWHMASRQPGTELLVEAQAALRAVLEVRTKESEPIAWAATMHNLGLVLQHLGERDPGTGSLREAAETYRSVLRVRSADRNPLEWAATQNNLGNTLQSLGHRECDRTFFEEAVTAFRAALQHCTRQRAPLEWAQSQGNLGNALALLGEETANPGLLREAAEAHRNALQEWTRERIPRYWAMAQHNLGSMLIRLGELENNPERFGESLLALRAALEERTRERDPIRWAMTQHSIGDALVRLGERESGTTAFEHALEAFAAALEEATEERVPWFFWTIQVHRAEALLAFAERASARHLLEPMIPFCEGARNYWSSAESPERAREAEELLARIRAEIANRSPE